MPRRFFHFAIILGLLLLVVSLGKAYAVALLLKVVAAAVSIFTGVGFTYIAGQGYYNQSLSVLINDSCSGFNYFIISLGTFSYLAYLRQVNMQRVWPWLAVAVMAVLLTLLANTGRISFCIWLAQLFPSYPLLAKPLVHQAVGIAFYFGFLTVFIALWHFKINKTLTHDTQTHMAAA